MMGNVCGGQKISMDAIAAYNNFLCTYGLLHTEMLPNDAIQCATRLWCNFSPEQQMSYAQMLQFPCQQNSFEHDIRSEYGKPPQTVAVPSKGEKIKLRVKTPAIKCQTKGKPTPTALRKKLLNATKKRKTTAYKGVKPMAKKSVKTGFQKFFKKLRDQHSQLSDEEIVKKAAKAWCSMNQKQRQRFLR